MTSFEGLAAGDYLVCSYNENQDCLPNPSPNTTDLDDVDQTGMTQDGCFAIECVEKCNTSEKRRNICERLPFLPALTLQHT